MNLVVENKILNGFSAIQQVISENENIVLLFEKHGNTLGWTGSLCESFKEQCQ